MKRLILAVAVFLLAVPVMAQSGQPVLTWAASTTSGVGYRIYRGTASGQESSTSLNATPITATTYTDTDTTLVPGTTYFYYVKSVLGSQNSAASNEASVMIPIVIVIPNPPSGLTIVIK